ncbi:MAG: hypothetical protein IJ701_06045 [Bacteroidales bacterium]|nr:hypothetical protein [Bacteroidales bacterium]
MNRDRPDLQSPDRKSIGIEVTRAMEESKKAGQELLKDVAGINSVGDDEDLDQILEYGYAYGLKNGRYIGVRELPFWSMALPLKRILESKVSKAGKGFYGHFQKMGLYVFCKDQLREIDARGAMNFTISLQKYQDIRYDRLYLTDVNDLFVCNLEDGMQDSFRLIRYPITQEQRKAFYLEAVRRQL